MDIYELKERIARWENLHTEFKVWPIHPNSLAKSLVGFTNTDGGQLIIGVNDNRKIIGVKDTDIVARQVDNVATNNCEIRDPCAKKSYNSITPFKTWICNQHRKRYPEDYLPS